MDFMNRTKCFIAKLEHDSTTPSPFAWNFRHEPKITQYLALEGNYHK